MSRPDRSPRRLPTTTFVARLSCILRVSVAGLAVLLPGCGDAPAPSAARVALTGATAGSEPAVHVVQRFTPPRERDQWSITADDISLVPNGEGQAGGELLRLTRDQVGTPIRLVRSGRFDLAAFDRVRVSLAASGGTLASAAFLRDGHVVAATEAVSVTHLATVGSVELPLPPVAAERGVATTLVLIFGDTPRAVRLASVELLSTPAARLVPPADGAQTLAALGDQARRGVGVSSGRPVQATFSVPPDGVLGFGLGVPPDGRWQGEDPRLVVTLSAADGNPPDVLETREFPLRRGERVPVWTSVQWPLGREPGERVVVRYEVLAPAGQQAACVVSEAAVWSRTLPPRPPLLLVTTDTHRGDHLGGAGRGVGVQTPVLDALAARGVLFEDCFVSANYTNPSHMALMTGNHPRDVGVLDNKHGLRDSAQTLAERLHEVGYRTWAALSAHHLGDTVSGLGQGFDRMTWPDLPQRPSAETLDVVEDWLTPVDGQPDERPLFLWLHVFDAHRPYDPPEDLLARYYDGPADPYDSTLPELPAELELPPEMDGLRVLDHPRAQYKALVSYLDAQLARMLDHPSMAGAVVAVVGDHGEELGDHDVWFDHAELYQDTLHVPLILAWPEAPAGTRVSRPVSHLDLGRTLLDLLGESAVPFPGISLAPVGESETPSNAPRYALSSHGSSASLTADGLHLILHLRTGHRRYEHHQVELYDLRSDPACQQDLVETRPAEARALRAQLVRWLGEAAEDTLQGETVTDPEVLADLARLGYTGEAGTGNATLWVPDDCAWCLRVE